MLYTHVCMCVLGAHCSLLLHRNTVHDTACEIISTAIREQAVSASCLLQCVYNIHTLAL
jgi:hypothetical protein